MDSSPQPFDPHSIGEAISALQQRFGTRLSTNLEIRRQHANTLTWIDNQPPNAVVWPESTDEVAAIVAVAARHRAPIIPFGAGTSLEGHVNAPFGGISIDMSRMDRVLEVNDRDHDCRVEAGISRKRLAEHLRDTGLFFPVDPGAEEATLGGMVSTRASGTTTMRYGSMRDNVLGLTAVMADGTVIRTGTRARKSAAGYDLTRLLVGAEGTLGIVTEVALRLHGQPEAIVAAVAPFDTLEGACNTAIDAVGMGGLGLARVELLDAIQIEAVNAHAHLDLALKPTLFLEFHGTPLALDEQVSALREIALANGATSFARATDETQRRQLWKARHEAYWAIRATARGRDILATDVCVPISRLAECVSETAADAERLGLTAPILGHVGDGNFHATPLFNRHDSAERARLETLLKNLVRRAQAAGGTCTGEHGIGQGKKAYLAMEVGAGLEVMAAIKQALDPLGILNPGKLLAGTASHGV